MYLFALNLCYSSYVLHVFFVVLFPYAAAFVVDKITSLVVGVNNAGCTVHHTKQHTNNSKEGPVNL